jgi:general secretion pathway protein I
VNFNPHADRGFTLLEVMIALAIIAIALGALISTSGSQASSAGYLKQKTIAHWVALNEITRLQVSKTWPDLGDSKDSVEMLKTEWLWTRTVKATEDKNSRQVEFRIFLDKDREYSLASMIGYLSNPAASTAIPDTSIGGAPTDTGNP